MKQSVHHPNVDCVHGCTEKNIFNPVCKKIAIYKYPLLPFINFVNAPSLLVGSCEREKPRVEEM